MRAIEMTGPGGPEVLRDVERPMPRPGAGRVLVDVVAAGLTLADVLARRGLPGYAPAWPHIPGVEVGGMVAEVGPGVEGLRVGDRVAALTPDGGGLAQYTLADARLTVRVPRAIQLDVAATVPATWATALGLVRTANVRPGDRVLVTAASGGVGAVLTALLSRLGVTVLVGGVGDAARARSLSAGYIPVERGGDFFAQARQAAGTDAFDVVLESVGGPVVEAALDALAPGGRLISYGAAAGRTDPPTRSYGELRANNWTIGGFSVIGLARGNPAAVGALIREVFDLAADGMTLPTPRCVPWAQAARAHLELGGAAVVGKTVVTVGSGG